MQLKRKKVTINYGGKKAVVVVRELTWGEFNDVISRASKIENIGGVTRSTFDFVAFREEMILRSIEEAPFKVDRETIRGLPAHVVEKIWQAVSELNPLA